MSRISITGGALRELGERMAHGKWPVAISIVGPLDYDVRAADNPEEAWAVQKLYGPPQRWILKLVPAEIIDDVSRQGFPIEEVSGITVQVLAPTPVPHLCVELVGDTIRVYEVDA